MRYIAAIALLSLAACGADGEPKRPAAPKPGISITGTVEMGIKG